MASRLGIVFSVRIGGVLGGLRLRKKNLYPFANAGAERIAAVMNTAVLPAEYPGRVSQSIVAIAEPSVRGGLLAAVRLHAHGSLWVWYEFGVKPHPIDAVNASVMAFQWPKMGYGPGRNGEFFFAHVDHPGYPGHHRLPYVRDAMREEARLQWREALREALLIR